MNSIDKRSLAARFSASASNYEDVTPIQGRMAQTLMERIGQQFAGKNVRSILELGCGTGRLTRQLITAFPEARIVVLDISHDMIAHTRDACPSVHCIIADAEDYIHRLEKGFDLVVSNATIQWFEDVDSTLGKAHDLLLPGGFLAMATFAERTFRELVQSFDSAYAAHHRVRREHVVPMRPVAEWLNRLPEAEILSEDIECVFPDVRTFLRSIQDAGAVNSLSRRYSIPKDVFKSMAEHYETHYSVPDTGGIRATYHACYLFREFK